MAPRPGVSAGVVVGRWAVCLLIALLPACGGGGEETGGQASEEESSGTAEPGGSSRMPAVENGPMPRHATVAKIDPVREEVEAIAPVGPKPLLLEVASGRIWTLNLGDGTLSRVNRSSNAVTPAGPREAVGIAADGRDLWVAHHGRLLSRLDGRTGREELEFELGRKQLFAPGDAGFVAKAPGSLWLTVPELGESDKPHSLWRIDPRTGVVERRLPLGRDVLPPLIYGRYIWVTATGERSVTRIDQRSGATTAVPGGPLPWRLAAGAGSIWVGGGDGQVRRIDPTTLRRVSATGVDGSVRSVAFGGGLLWVTTTARVEAIDPTTDEVTISLSLGDFEPDTGPTAVGFLDDSVWVSIE